MSEYAMSEYYRLQTEMQTEDILAQIDALLERRPYSIVATGKLGWAPDFNRVTPMPKWLEWIGKRQRLARRRSVGPSRRVFRIFPTVTTL